MRRRNNCGICANLPHPADADWLAGTVHDYDDFAWTPPHTLARLAEGRTPWEFYRNTMMRFETTGGAGVLRPADEDGQSAPPFGSLHVVTAIQPGTEPAHIGRARMQVLDRHLHAAGIRAMPAVGSSLTGDHSEDSRAVFGLTDVQARELGARFGQVAVFAWRGPRWSLLACAGDRQSHRGWHWDRPSL